MFLPLCFPHGFSPPRVFHPWGNTSAPPPPPTLFQFVAHFARVTIGDSSRNRFASTAYFAWEKTSGGEKPGGNTGVETSGGESTGHRICSSSLLQLVGSLCCSYGVTEVSVLITVLNLYPTEHWTTQNNYYTQEWDKQMINYTWKCLGIWFAWFGY